VYPQVQAIVYEGKVFVGTEMGNMYALDAQTGEQEWTYNVGAPILNSVAAGDGKVFFGALDGTVYALEVTTGSLAWRSSLSWRLGFSTAPVFAENKVMLGGRNGVFYALDPDTGATLWQYEVGSPILQTAAWNNGKVYFGAMDMHVYAIHTADGSLAWQSEKIPGLAFKDYWPVVYDGKVLIRPMGMGGIDAGFPFDEIWSPSNPNWDWVMQHGPTIAGGRLTDVSDAMDAQNAAMADYQANPGNYTKNLLILDESTGEEAFAVPHWTAQTMNGATTPPCVDRDGTFVVPVTFIRSGWGRLDLTIQRMTDILYDHIGWYSEPIEPGDYPAGMGNSDENLNVTCTGDSVLAMHTEEINANYTGVFDLNNRRWTRINPGHTNRQMSSNTQGGGGNPASVSDGMIYHISWHELIARAAQP
jgi:outer membrane protein assembly factor BamB